MADLCFPALMADVGGIDGQATSYGASSHRPYNNDRPNMGIGGITPAMKLKMAA